MSKKKLVGSITISIFLVFALLLLYAKKNSNSVESVNLKEIIRFEDLPKQTQDEYIHKNDLKTLEHLGIVQKSNSKELVVQTDEPIKGSIDEIKAQVITLRQKNNFLYQDNIDLANKNWELALKLNDKQKELEEEQQKLITQNLESMNEAEQQHYQNINDLTKRITLLQEESMSDAKKYENKIINLENQVHELEKKLRQKSLNTDEKITAATKEQRISNSTLAEKNRYLLEQLKALEKKLGKQLDEKEARLNSQKSEIKRLRVVLQEKEAEQNTFLTNHTKEIMAMEYKQNSNIQNIIKEYKEEKELLQKQIENKNDEIEALITKHDNKLKELRNDSIKLEGDLEKERLIGSKMLQTHEKALGEMQAKIDKLRTENIKLEKQIVLEKKSMEDALQEKAKEYAAALEDIKADSLQYNEKENIKIETLKDELSIAKNSLNEKNIEISEIKAELAKVEKNLKEAFVSKDVALEENEAKHADNYVHLNEKIVKLEHEKGLILDKTNKHLNNTKEELLDVKKSFEKEIVALKEANQKLQKENGSLKLNSDAQLLELKDEFEELRRAFSEREVSYEDKITQLEKTLKQQQEESQALIEKAAVQKPKLLASITCDDMESGTNRPTAICEDRVKKFLKEFKPNHFYEVVPIVDDGGFATLKRVQNSNLNIKKDEIERLTRLSNLGLGKDRAASGGSLVDDFFEGLARISYAVEGVKMKDKRGFIIRVYR